jgi:hypothetical protein
VIVVVASAHDPRARDLVAYWGPQCATLLAAEDLSQPGWAFEVPPGPCGRCVAGGKIIPDEAIAGVLTLRPRILAAELVHVASADRDYVAAEMTAVLRAWLAARRCPVVNAPSGVTLAGPNWRLARWHHEALALDIPVARAAHQCVDLIVTGKRCLGTDDPQLLSSAVALAHAARTELLGCRFTPHGHFIGATPWPALDQTAVRNNLFELLGGCA